jgi:hypothetical protein
MVIVGWSPTFAVDLSGAYAWSGKRLSRSRSEDDERPEQMVEDNSLSHWGASMNAATASARTAMPVIQRFFLLKRDIPLKKQG